MCLETDINCFTMAKYHFSRCRRNATFWSKVGETGVGEQGIFHLSCLTIKSLEAVLNVCIDHPSSAVESRSSPECVYRSSQQCC